MQCVTNLVRCQFNGWLFHVNFPMFGDSENSFIDSCYSQMSTQTVFTVLHDFAAVRKQQIETIYSIF